jgi:uncharacterized protein YycO
MKLIFATDSEPLSKVIRTVTSCRWHHVGVIFDDYVIEARFSGVLKTPLADVKARGDYAVVDHAIANEDKALAFALEQVGKGYDIAGLIGFPFRARWQDPTRWYCSELVAAIAEAGGTPLVRTDLAGVSPRDLWVIKND